VSPTITSRAALTWARGQNGSALAVAAFGSPLRPGLAEARVGAGAKLEPCARAPSRPRRPHDRGVSDRRAPRPSPLRLAPLGSATTVAAPKPERVPSAPSATFPATTSTTSHAWWTEKRGPVTLSGVTPRLASS